MTSEYRMRFFFLFFPSLLIFGIFCVRLFFVRMMFFFDFSRLDSSSHILIVHSSLTLVKHIRQKILIKLLTQYFLAHSSFDYSSSDAVIAPRVRSCTYSFAANVLVALLALFATLFTNNSQMCRVCKCVQ